MTADVRRIDADRPRLGPLLWLAEVQPVVTGAYVVRDLIAAGTAAVVYGDANSGKTFFVLDLALHVAAGRPWRSHRVQAGVVLYVAAEGGHGIRNRLAAYRQTATWTRGAPFAVLPAAIDLLNPAGDTAALIDLVKAAETEAGANVALVVLDTLARVIPGGNENDAGDMGALIGNVDRLRAETGAAVLLVHHSGKDFSRGARGHSSLRAAVDTEILVEGQHGTRLATVVKQRDMLSGQRFTFDLVPITLANDDEGRPITSCVVAISEAPPPVSAEPRGKHQTPLLAAIRRWQDTHPDANVLPADELRDLAKAQGMDRRRSSEAVKALVAGGHLERTTSGYRLASA